MNKPTFYILFVLCLLQSFVICFTFISSIIQREWIYTFSSGIALLLVVLIVFFGGSE
jgi:uncharacterized SAM-binding protein YcdF (DUF218 family)